MSFSVRKSNDPVYIFQNTSTSSPNDVYWINDLSGNILNTNSSQDVKIQGQIIAKNGLGVVDQVLALTNTGEMVWKDVSGSGGLANQIEVFDNTTNKSYFLTMVEGSGNEVFYIDSSGLAFNPVTNFLGINTITPTKSIDISQGTIRVNNSTTNSESLQLNKFGMMSDISSYSQYIEFMENNTTKAYIWYERQDNIFTNGPKLRLGSGSGQTSWDIEVSGNGNCLVYGAPNGSNSDSILSINSTNTTPVQFNKLLRCVSGNNINPLVYTRTGRLGLGTEVPTHRLDVSYADISAMRVGNTLNVDTSNNRIGINTKSTDYTLDICSSSIYSMLINNSSNYVGVTYQRDSSANLPNNTDIFIENYNARINNTISSIYRNAVIYNGDGITRRGKVWEGCSAGGTPFPYQRAMTQVGSTRINIIGENVAAYVDDTVNPDLSYNMHASNIINALSTGTLGLLSLDINGITNHKFFLNGNVTFGATTNNPKAIVDISSNSKGFMPPRMTATQANAIAPTASEEGLMVYVTNTGGTPFNFTSKGWWGYNGSTWTQLG